MSLAALGASTPIREIERALEQLLAGRRPILLLGEPGHRARPRGARVAGAGCALGRARQRRAARRQSACRCSRRHAKACSIAPEIGAVLEVEQRGLAFLLPKLDKLNVTLVCTSTEPLGNLAAEGKFDAALLAQLSAGTVMLPPLRKRREDIPPLIERYWREACKDDAAARHARGAATGRAHRAVQCVLAGQSRSPGELPAEPRAGARRDHDRAREARARRGRRRPTPRSRPRSRRASSTCRCARRARRSSASTSSSCSAASRAT